MNNLKLPLVCLFLSNTCIYAQLQEEGSKQESQNHSSKHHIALFNGATTNFSHESTSYTIGLDYEYRISKLLGIGLLGEVILADSEEFLTGVAVCAHPFKGTKLIAAPLVVFSEEHHSEGHEIKKESSFAFRIGAGYDFHVGKLSLGPTVDFDFGKTEALNYGLSIGFGF